jgi:hypothetical protein
MSDIFLDGGGVIPAQALPDGTRIVFRTGTSGDADVTAYVEHGILVLKGQYRRLLVAQPEANTVEVKAW